MSNPRLAASHRKRSPLREAATFALDLLKAIGKWLTRDKMSLFLLVSAACLGSHMAIIRSIRFK